MALALASSSPAQQTIYLKEETIGRLPVDLVLTPNARLGIVRSEVPDSFGTDGLSVVDMATGDLLFINSCSTAAGRGAAINPSDFVQATNSRAILVGGRDANFDLFDDTTAIDVLAFDMSTTPPTPSCLKHHELGSTTLPNQAGGNVSDVTLTPDESFAIINSQNWIHVVEMATGNIAAAFNIGSPPYFGPCTPGFSSDSVAATDTTAVVTTVRLTPPPQKSMTWVYLIDLTTPTPTLALEHLLPEPVIEDPRDFDPHDIAITPSGELAVVSASDVVGVYDLVQRTFVARHQFSLQTERIRLFSEIVDSVEVTNSRAVVIAKDRKGVAGSNLTEFWTADVYALPAPTSPSMVPLGSYRLRDYMVFSQYPPLYQGTTPIAIDRPHDLLIDSLGEQAVIRSGLFNVVLTDLATPDPLDIVHDYRGYGSSNLPTSATFVSDSVLIAPPFYGHVIPGQGSGLRHYAVTIGAAYTGGGGIPTEARIDVIDLAATPPVVVNAFNIPDPTGSPYIMPADITFGSGTREFVVRCAAAPFFEPPPGNGGRDFLRFSLNPPALVSQTGLTGSVFAVDSVEVRRLNALTVSEQTTPMIRGFLQSLLLN